MESKARGSGLGTKVTIALLCAVLALGLCLRVIHYLAIAETGFIEMPAAATETDLHATLRWAQSIASGDLLGRDTYHPYFLWMQSMAPLEQWYEWWGGKEIFQQAPLYSYLIAALLALPGVSLSGIILLQLILGALDGAVIFFLARRLFGARVGLLAAFLTALYGPFIFHQGTLLRDCLPPIWEPLLLLLMLRALERQKIYHWTLAGAVLGIALLIKKSILFFAPFALFWILISHKESFPRRAWACTAFALGALLSLSPLLLRNAAVGAPLLAISNRGVEGFIEANAADGSPVGLQHPRSMKFILERSAGRIVPAVRETLQTYRGDWTEFFRRQGVKLRSLIDPVEIPNNVSFNYGLRLSPVLGWTLGYGLLFPLGFAGLLFSLRQWRRHGLLLLYALTTLASFGVLPVVARYRLVLVPVLVIYGAFGLIWLFDELSKRHLLRAAAYGLCVGGAALAQHVFIPLDIVRKNPSINVYPVEHVAAARVYSSRGQFGKTLEELDELEARFDAFEARTGVEVDAALIEQLDLLRGSYLIDWTRQLIKDGQTDEARKRLNSASQAFAHHLDLAGPNRRIGILYLALDEPAAAEPFLARYLQLAPQGAHAARIRELLGELRRAHDG